MTAEAICEGFPLMIRATLEVRHIQGLLRRLRESGVIPRPQPLVFDKTADGLPICPVHHVPMREREKQGDRWFSHRVITTAGVELWCRGYPDPSTSPGFFHESAVPHDDDSDSGSGPVALPPAAAAALPPQAKPVSPQRPAELPIPAAAGNRGAYGPERPRSRRYSSGGP
jgi:hypothetical protein